MNRSGAALGDGVVIWDTSNERWVAFYSEQSNPSSDF